MTIFSGNPKFTGPWYKEHSLSLVLLLVFVLQCVVVWFSGLSDWRGGQEALNQSTAIYPDYLIHWVYEMAVSVVADTYGALLLVLLGKWFFEKGSPASKDMEEE